MQNEDLELWRLNFMKSDPSDKWILVVEDDLNMREVIHKIVTKELNRFCVMAEDAHTALQILRHNWKHIEAVLCDIHLPMFDGVTLLRIARLEDNLDSIMFCFLTNYDNKENRQKAETLGGAKFLCKQAHANPKSLIKAIREAIAPE